MPLECQVRKLNLFRNRIMTKASHSQQSAVDLFRHLSYLRQLSTEVAENLVAVATCHRYESGTMLFCEGDQTSGLHIIEEGSVKISRFTAEGREHILHIFGRGDSFNDVSALDGGPNPATATAFTKVTVWRIRREDLQQVARQYPELAWSLLGSIAARTRYMVGLVEDLAMRSVKGRLAHLLLEQAQANRANEVPRYMTHEEMANHLGTVREMIGRGLQSLSAAGIIKIDRHRITILDAEKLAEEAKT